MSVKTGNKILKKIAWRKIKTNSTHAFSLIELSIVILIISVLASSGLTIFKSTNSVSKTKITKERIDAVYKALGNYLITNRRLPCPASLELANNDANYGNEVRTTTCPATTSGGVIVSTVNPNLAYGMVPTKTLGLSSDMAEDGFGTKLSYVIDKRFAIKVGNSGTDGFEGTNGNDLADGSTVLHSNPIINIKELSVSGPDIITNGIMVILSHGANKYGGFNSAGVVQNDPASASVDERDNAINSFVSSPSLAGNFNNVFVTNSSDTTFDDFLIFKTKVQLAIDAGFESMLCRAAEANDPYTCGGGGTLLWNNANYGELVDSSSTAPTPSRCKTGCANNNSRYGAKVCGKYGIWGPNLYPCI